MSLIVSTRNARFQQWDALRHNRTKRAKLGAFLVQGVRPISAAVAAGRPIRTLLHDGTATSRWAADLLAGHRGEIAELAPELLQELSDKNEDRAELIAVVAIPDDDPARLGTGGVVVVLDRPSSPGNIGTLIRSADALGTGGVIVTGHAADVYDPKCVRASRGCLFSVPVVRIERPAQAASWLRAGGFTLVGTDEQATEALWDAELTGPLAVVVGNETIGMSGFWRTECDLSVQIPMAGTASSFNAAVAASITLYEIARRRASRGAAAL